MRGKKIKIIILIALLFGLAGLLYAQTAIHPNTGRIEKQRFVYGNEGYLPQAFPTPVVRAVIGAMTPDSPFTFRPAAQGRVTASASTAGLTVNSAMINIAGGASYPITSPGDTRPLLVSYASVNFLNTAANADTIIASTRLHLGSIIVNVAGTASAVSFWADPSVPCNSGYIFTLPTVTTGQIHEIMFAYPGAICMSTVGTAPADITLLYSFNQ